MTLDDDMIAFSEFLEDAEPYVKPWLILTVDDNIEIHDVTRLAIGKRLVHGRPLAFLQAYSGKEAIAIVESNQDIDFMFLDAIMESPTAGIDCARYIKVVLERKLPIIVMRTGWAGSQLEAELDRNPYLDDYIFKTESSIDALLGKLEKWLKP